jgi:hypothetical protein
VKLEMLRRANVVDAGARLRQPGKRRVPETGIAPDDAAINLISDDEVTAGSQVDPEHCYASARDRRSVDRRHLREQMPRSASLVVAGLQSKVRVHIHVNDPAEVFRVAARFGTVSGEKADDMQRQQTGAPRGAAGRGRRTRGRPAGTCWTARYPRAPVRALGTHSYLDKVGCLGEFFRMLASARTRTSQPPPETSGAYSNSRLALRAVV